MTHRHIELRGTVYYVTGTKISLDSIVYCFREGCSPESIRGDFPALTLANVYGALSFYLDNRADVDAYLLRRREEWRELERNGTPLNPELRARMDRAREAWLRIGKIDS